MEVEAAGQQAAFKNRHFSYKRIVYLSLHVPVVIEYRIEVRFFLCAIWQNIRKIWFSVRDGKKRYVVIQNE